ncbi:AraC family transcriptional regulator [Lutibacter sp. B1]|uniref:helix-turn-helix domain-containing protein n=1 Tax=Lutibacter sp. B1 TaxID=2725996 RepID=UPI00145635FA|nr:helix-turn-helix transcriptional regulator [Lutibacter sp. B1]NLP58342.1 helix-turn-helix transcriptional regulator [Lutibacter sp. B1]
MKLNYSIRDVLNFRKLEWGKSNDFFYLTDIPSTFEPDFFKPNYFSFGLLDKGFIKIEIDDNTHIINNRSFMIYRPEQIIQISQIHPKTKGAFILFTKQFLDYLNENIFSVTNHSFLSYQFDSHIELDTSDYKKLKKVSKKIFDLLSETPSGSWEYIARNLTSALVYETNEILKKYLPKDFKKKDCRSFLLTNDFKNLVEKHYYSNRNIRFYASELNISVNYLHKIIKKHTGKTPLSIINAKLLSEVKQVLSCSNINISEIALKYGFSGVSSFSKYFKNQTSVSPSTYHKKSIQN